MSIFDRLFGSGRQSEPTEAELALERATEGLQASSEKLSRLLEADPCAADPTREECDPETRRLIRQRPDLAGALLSGRETWRRIDAAP